MRLNQFLAKAGFGSRRSCEQLITEGKVAVNGRVERKLAVRVASSDRVTVNNKPVQAEQPLTIILNKPKGVVCSTTGQGRRSTVFDLLPKKRFPRLFYVGRLDADSEGLLILTNQGALAQKLTHPKHKLSKIYRVRLDQPFDFRLTPKLLKGFRIEPGFARAEAVHRLSKKELKVVLTQGLKRQIRLMFFKLGYNVVALQRIQVGNLKLGGLKPGEWKILAEGETQRLEMQGKAASRNEKTEES